MTLVVVRGTTVYVANVGDSRVVLGFEPGVAISRGDVAAGGGSGGGADDSAAAIAEAVAKARQAALALAPGGRLGRPTVVQLSVDHKPDLPDERARIEASGGRVKSTRDTSRVYLATDDIPGLAMSRSLGDFVAHRVGVSAVPDFFEYDLSDLCAAATAHAAGAVGAGSSAHGAVAGRAVVRTVLLVGTDGVYDMISNASAVHVGQSSVRPCDFAPLPLRVTLTSIFFSRNPNPIIHFLCSF